MQQETTNRPQTNPRARDPGDVLGTALPDTVSAATWVRPYEYLVVRTDDNRCSSLDDHPEGRIMSAGLHTRHNAIGRAATLRRRNPDGTYQIIAEPNSNYEGDQ
jgi:hypothetical protein